MSRYITIKYTLFLGALAFLVGALSCTGSSSAHHASPPTLADDAPFNRYLVDSATHLLQTGDVVLRMGYGPHSLLLSRLNATDKRFSHCGIVLLEQGYPFVYHCVGGEENPNARLRRDSAARFFAPGSNSAIGIARYALSAHQLQQLISHVHHYYDLRPRFDLRFDLATDSLLYCTEFVYKVLSAAVADTAYIPLSYISGHPYVGTDNLYLNPHAALVWQVRYK